MKFLCIVGVVTFLLNSAFAEELMYSGKKPIDLFHNQISSFVERSDVTTSVDGVDRSGQIQIRNLLALESRLKTVGEAIEVKTKGLAYVYDSIDFDYLTSYAFANPSSAYVRAVGDFIAAHAEKFVRSSYDIYALRNLESRSIIVSNSMAVKKAGMLAPLNISDFVYLIQPAVSNPSSAYLDEISKFTAQYIQQVVDHNSSISEIIEAESMTLRVNEAMAVKNAGLVAVRNQSELFALAQSAFPNPSEAYLQAVNEFLKRNLLNFPAN